MTGHPFSSLPCTAALVCSVFLAGSANAAPDFSGVWRLVGDGAARPADGGQVPLTPKGEADRARNAASAAKGDYGFDDTLKCMPAGLPRILSTPLPFQILQTSRTVVFLHQANHDFRVAYLKEGHRPDQDPAFYGDSSARFDGDVLIVDTVNFKPALLDRTGIPTTEGLKVVERYRKVDADHIEAQITVEDPAIFTKPWSYAIAFERQAGLRIAEDVCMDKDAAARAAMR